MWAEEGEVPDEDEEAEPEPPPACIMYWSCEAGKEPSWLL